MPRGRPKRQGVQREPNGRIKRELRPPSENAMKTALIARANIAGIALDMAEVNGRPQVILTKAKAEILRQPWMGCVAGRAIRNERDVVELWQTIQLIRARRHAWLRCIDAPAEVAKGASIQTEPNPLGDGDFAVSPPADTRTPEEKAVAAERQWAEIEALMFAANPLMQRVVLLDDEQIRGDVAAWVRHVMEALK